MSERESRYDHIRDVVSVFNRTLASSQTFRARLLYGILLIALFFDVPKYLPVPNLASQCLTALAIGAGIWVGTGFIPQAFRQIAVEAKGWPRPIQWVVYIGMLAASLVELAITLSLLLFVEPALDNSPLRDVIIALVAAGGVVLVPILATVSLVVVGLLLVLVVWLPFMAARGIFRRYIQRRLPYEQYSRSREFR